MKLRRSAIKAGLWLCRAAGLFALARRATRHKLRILCYHGFVTEDEDLFRPSTFLSGERFAQRLSSLKRGAYPVLPLGEAIRLLNAGKLPPNAVTITIDDGFYSTHAVAKDILARAGMPSTLYLTSYYFTRGTPVLQVAMSYICWKSPLQRVDLSSLGVPSLARHDDLLLDPDVREWLGKEVHEFNCELEGEGDRENLARRLAKLLEVDFDAIVASRKFSLINAEELHDLMASGMAIELHTHRHRFPENRKLATDEIADNRAAIEPLTKTRMAHFCYPSGIWSARHFAILEDQGVQSATTCLPGLVAGATDRMALPRILDDTRVSQIEFEAEISGFMELVRQTRHKFASGSLALAYPFESIPTQALATIA